MNVPLWVAELAETFWELAGRAEPFPRTLHKSITRALPMIIVLLPRLRLLHAFGWLRHNKIACSSTAADRDLHACLAAWRGWGYVFLDGTDPEDEQRLSLAHELAHFLRHYWHPRRLACSKLGNQVLEVLDGDRRPTAGERVHALLASVPIGCHFHLLDRDPQGGFPTETVLAAESEADRLAYRLLAPAEEVLNRGASRRGQDLAELLRVDFGLPANHALLYSNILSPPLPVDSLLRRLRLG